MKIICPFCNTKFNVKDEGYCPECGYFYKIKSKEMYKLDNSGWI